MSDIQLSLNPNNGNNPNGIPEPEDKPYMGWFAVAFGFLGIFTYGTIFVPLGLICSILAFFFGQALWGFLGLLLNIMGLITSPKLLLLIGLAAFAQWFDMDEFMRPFYDMIGVEPTQGEDI